MRAYALFFPVFALSALSAAAQSGPADISVEIVKLGPAAEPLEIAPPDDGWGAAEPILDSIVNIGQRAWKIIVDNKPVVDVRTQYATALPEGARSWSAMDGWHKPQGTVYQLTAKNAYGVAVVNLRYQVLRTAGGSYEGVGRYLTAVTVQPLLVEVAWGYTFTLEAAVPDTSVVNVGTKDDPVAGMLAELSWRVRTPFKDAQGKGVYYLQGDGGFEEIGGAFTRAGLDGVKSRIALTAGETLSYGP
ncbi:MAG: hypothetical protein HYZ74_01170 [Elusimicrobia bacterium]|nr:hypothetical protein [Elusimicrobiota bacterium]